MNIENFKPIPNLSLRDLFEKQKEIKFLYEPGSKQIFENFDIDCYSDQELFKKYCWRVVEELTEALEDQKNLNHLQEEIIDSFNFLIELFLLYGWNEKKVEDVVSSRKTQTLNESMLDVIYQLGITCNILKNRQWRQSQYLVDLLIFEKRFLLIWQKFMELFNALDLSMERVYEIWSLKYQVNLFRIQTKY